MTLINSENIDVPVKMVYRTSNMLYLWVTLLVAHCGSSIYGFVAPLQQPPRILGSRSSPGSLLKNTADDTTTKNDDGPMEILVNFPDPTEENQGGYSLNGYTGSSAYQSALNNPQPGILSRNVAYNMEEFNEDGYGDMRAAGKKRFMVERLLKFPFRALRRITRRSKNNVEPGVLILVRHGESVWNANKTFTGEFISQMIDSVAAMTVLGLIMRIAWSA